ncbi:class I SAM-dependent methyltransferase [Embleya scabrispora]|uniref:class I SAM-dependent methyltransferase n=1 Tax=Embleya scabrispora TaxID=159449 RepID=UPI00036AAC85|nr:methyltransferase domain-containing protein [Embleya scabrispora]MYS81333.1 methyltransferase domain-containing protein [Streptomyces sp. SID5474]
MALPPTEADPSDPIRILDVAGDDYRRVFELFLAGSNEKAVTHAHLSALVEQLPRRSVFLDIGAGSGTTTRHVGNYFEHTIAIEPGSYMRDALRRACPDARVLPDPVETADPGTLADFALCSHMLYYLPQSQWLPTVRRFLGWVRPGGELVLALQNPNNECMRLVRHFFGIRFDLAATANALRAGHEDLVESCTVETLPVRFHADNLADTLTVAEFMANVPNLAELESRPTHEDLERYVLTHFADPDGAGFSIGHDHDIVRIRRSSRP